MDAPELRKEISLKNIFNWRCPLSWFLPSISTPFRCNRSTTNAIHALFRNQTIYESDESFWYSKDHVSL
jgi:hypothetical protein